MIQFCTPMEPRHRTHFYCHLVDCSLLVRSLITLLNKNRLASSSWMLLIVQKKKDNWIWFVKIESMTVHGGSKFETETCFDRVWTLGHEKSLSSFIVLWWMWICDVFIAPTIQHILILFFRSVASLEDKNIDEYKNRFIFVL